MMTIMNDDTENTDTGNSGSDDDSGEEAVVKNEDQEADDKSDDKPDDKSDDAKKDEDKGDDDKPDDKSDDAKKDEDKGDDEDKPEGAPESYTDFTIPEGFDVDETRLERFQKYGKDNNLTQDAAQELIDLHAEVVTEVATSNQDRWDVIRDGWKKDSLADKELHDEKGDAKAGIALAKTAAIALGGEELIAAFDLTGVGDHPAVTKAFHKLGKAMEEDKFVFGNASSKELSAAQVLYPSMKDK